MQKIENSKRPSIARVEPSKILYPSRRSIYDCCFYVYSSSIYSSAVAQIEPNEVQVRKRSMSEEETGAKANCSRIAASRPAVHSCKGRVYPNYLHARAVGATSRGRSHRGIPKIFLFCICYAVSRRDWRFVFLFSYVRTFGWVGL